MEGRLARKLFVCLIFNFCFRFGPLSTSKIYRVRGETVICFPLTFELTDFYSNADPSTLIEDIKVSILNVSYTCYKFGSKLSGVKILPLDARFSLNQKLTNFLLFSATLNLLLVVGSCPDILLFLWFCAKRTLSANILSKSSTYLLA